MKGVFNPQSGLLALVVIPAEENVIWNSRLQIRSLSDPNVQQEIEGTTGDLPVWSNDSHSLTYLKLLSMDGVVYHYQALSMDALSGQVTVLGNHDAMDVHLLSWSA